MADIMPPHADTDALLAVYERFVALERTIAAHGIAAGGVRVWSAARSEVFRKILVATGTTADFQNVSLAYSASRGQLIRNATLGNPFLAGRPADTVIFRWERRHGSEGDPISNAVAASLKGSGRVIQIEARGNPAEGADRYSLDAIGLAAKLVAKRLRLQPTTAERERIKAAEAAITESFGVKVPLLDYFTRYAIRFESRARVLTALFRRLAVKRVFIVVAYAFPDIIEAAHRAGARAIELQHGLIFRSHTGYDFPDGLDPAYRPDEIWLFGEHWRIAARHDPATVLSVFGAPHIRGRIAAAAALGREKREALIVLSQPAITGELVRFAIDLARLPATPPLLYRLHPNENADLVRREVAAAGLAPDRFEISVGGGGGRTMELQSEHRYQLGVFSTAVVEGLALGCRTMILGIPGWSALQSLVDGGLASLVTTPDEAAAVLAGGASSGPAFDQTHLFA